MICRKILRTSDYWIINSEIWLTICSVQEFGTFILVFNYSFLPALHMAITFCTLLSEACGSRNAFLSLSEMQYQSVGYLMRLFLKSVGYLR